MIVAAIAIAAVALVANPGDDGANRVFPLPVSEDDKTYLPADEAEVEYRAIRDRMVADLKSSKDADAMASVIRNGDGALTGIHD